MRLSFLYFGRLNKTRIEDHLEGDKSIATTVNDNVSFDILDVIPDDIREIDLFRTAGSTGQHRCEHEAGKLELPRGRDQ